MNLLLLVWDLSLVLAGGALAIMVALIVARLVDDRRMRRREVQRQALLPALLGAGELSADEASSMAPEVVADVSTNLIRLVRGADRDAFVHRATRIGVPLQLTQALRSRSARKRLAAAEAIGVFADGTSLEALRRALDDPNEDVRLAAALSLASAGDTKSAGETLHHLDLGEGEPSLLMVSLFRRIAADRPDDIKALILDPATHSLARVAAVEALSTTGDYSLVPQIGELAIAAADDSEELPRYLHALGELGHPAARLAVLNGLHRPGMAARAAAATAVGRIGLVEAADTLAALLDDREWWVRFRSAEALIRIGDGGKNLLRQAARAGSERSRDAARTMLEEHGLEW